MKPIVNPWLFYLANISESAKNTCIIISVITGIITLIYAIIVISLKCDCDFEIDEKWHWGKVKIFTIFFIVTLFGALFMPSQKTCYTMIAASMVTPDNISTAGNTALDVINYIVESVLEIKESE